MQHGAGWDGSYRAGCRDLSRATKPEDGNRGRAEAGKEGAGGDDAKSGDRGRSLRFPLAVILTLLVAELPDLLRVPRFKAIGREVGRDRHGDGQGGEEDGK